MTRSNQKISLTCNASNWESKYLMQLRARWIISDRSREACTSRSIIITSVASMIWLRNQVETLIKLINVNSDSIPRSPRLRKSAWNQWALVALNQFIQQQVETVLFQVEWFVCSNDKMIKIWDTASGQEIFTPRTHQFGIHISLVGQLLVGEWIRG